MLNIFQIWCKIFENLLKLRGILVPPGFPTNRILVHELLRESKFILMINIHY